MIVSPFKIKDPDSTVPRWFDWSQYAADRGSDVASYALAIEDSPDSALVISDDTREGNVISFWLSGGTLDETYTVRCRIALADGTVDDYSRTQTIAQL